jgi:ABC-2 type transport system permease protein
MTVAWKTAADLLASLRFPVMVLVGAAPLWLALRSVPDDGVVAVEVPFLEMLTRPIAGPFSYAAVLGSLVPLAAILFLFDAANGREKRRSLVRALARPIFRDAWFAGTFIGGVIALALALLVLWLLIVGFGIVVLGMPPAESELLRSLAWLLALLVYGSTWLALALGLSVVIATPARSFFVAMLAWLVLVPGWHLASASPAIADLNQMVGCALKWSPAAVADTLATAMLDPLARQGFALSRDPALLSSSPLPFTGSALMVWPQASGLLAASLLVFTFFYVIFQRRPIRL